MGRLTAIGSRVGRLPAKLAPLSDAEGHGRETWRGWYKLARWKRLRWATLVRDLFTCQWPGCGKVEPDASQLVCDHRIPHRGDPRLFWDPLNLWTLCKPHHDSAKQREERQG